MDKREVFFSGEYSIILVKLVCRGPFLLSVYGVFILRRDVLLHDVEIHLLVWAVR
jgi:hypothetical protein